MVQRLHQAFDDVPDEYHPFLKELSLNCSVTGLLNVTSERPLEILESFCERNIDLRSPNEHDNLQLVKKELPALWQCLLQILKLEKQQKFLPWDVSYIVKKLISIRRGLYRTAPDRRNQDYISYPENQEEPTQCYPNWALYRYPKEYRVNGNQDQHNCNKQFNKAKDFAFGLFSIGCCCRRNITLGFELMLKKESSQNLFRVLMCRDLNFENLKGICFDFACQTDRYMLNREPREFKNIQKLVDSCHWKNHTSCSSGYNFENYKDEMPAGFFSQGREQVHAKLSKLNSSFRQSNYVSFMNLHKVYFAIENLTNNGLL